MIRPSLSNAHATGDANSVHGLQAHEEEPRTSAPSRLTEPIPVDLVRTRLNQIVRKLADAYSESKQSSKHFGRIHGSTFTDSDASSQAAGPPGDSQIPCCQGR